MSVSALLVLFGSVVTLGLLAFGAVVILAKARRGKEAPPPEPVPTSLSLMAGLSFFSGLGAILLITMTALFSLSLSMGDLLEMDSDVRAGLDLAGRIILYVSLLPAVAAIAFALGARGVISESGGTMRGRPLYRTGLLMAVVAGVVVLQSASGFSATDWTVSQGKRIRGEAELNRGYLGVETGPLDSMAGSPVLRVVPGSPADRAGLKAGDIIMRIDGRYVYQLPPLGTANDSSYDPRQPYVASYVGSLKPGFKLALGVRRGKDTLNIGVELAASFESLLALLRDQSFDHERLAVLKAAGHDRRYSADELLRICKSFDFDEGRVKAIEPALPILQDPQNAFRILGALDFPDAKSKVSGWITEKAKPSKDE